MFRQMAKCLNCGSNGFLEDIQRGNGYCGRCNIQNEQASKATVNQPSFPSHQPSSFQPQQQSFGGVQPGGLEEWARNNPHIGIGQTIYGTFLLILIVGAIWLFVTVLPFLLAVLGFLFSAALVIGAIIGVIWLIATITNAFSGEQNPPQ